LFLNLSRYRPWFKLSSVTVLEVIQRSTEFLNRKGVDSARLQTELLLSHVLKTPRMQLYLNFERTLRSEEEEAVRELIKRRGQREPLQQIVGATSFCGLEMKLNRHVLIPRPETELLAEEGWKFLQEVSKINVPPTALDFGTGSGCIAIALAAHCPSASIIALEKSTEALQLACENAASNNVAERVQFLSGDSFALLPPATRFHLIISNPPYIASPEIAALQPEVRDFEPRQALDGGPDGLDYYRKLAQETASRLTPDGKLMLEFGDGQAEPIREIFESKNWIVEAIREDYTQRARILILHGKPAH
jgi:release factor glutamine methyltransferase